MHAPLFFKGKKHITNYKSRLQSNSMNTSLVNSKVSNGILLNDKMILLLKELQNLILAPAHSH